MGLQRKFELAFSHLEEELVSGARCRAHSSAGECIIISDILIQHREEMHVGWRPILRAEKVSNGPRRWHLLGWGWCRAVCRELGGCGHDDEGAGVGECRAQAWLLLTKLAAGLPHSIVPCPNHERREPTPFSRL